MDVDLQIAFILLLYLYLQTISRRKRHTTGEKGGGGKWISYFPRGFSGLLIITGDYVSIINDVSGAELRTPSIPIPKPVPNSLKLTANHSSNESHT